MSRAVAFWLAVLLVFSGSTVFWMVWKKQQETVVGTLQVKDTDPAPVGPKLDEFELTDQTGARVNSKQYDGKVWAGSFFFAACPSICYQQNIKLQQLHAKYADRGLELMSITCDPVNDTPAALARYASRFNADANTWKFLTPADADMDYLRRVGNDFFKVAIDVGTHTDRVILFNRKGEQVGGYSVMKLEEFTALDQQIETLLATTATESDQQPNPGNEAESDETDDELNVTQRAVESPTTSAAPSLR